MFLREQELASSPTSLSTSSFPKFHQANQVLRGYTARNKAFFFTLLSFSCASLVRPSSGRRRRGGCVLSAEERGRRGRGRGGALAEGQPRGRNLSFLFLTPLANLALSTISFLFVELVDGKTPQKLHKSFSAGKLGRCWSERQPIHIPELWLQQ